MNPSRGAVPSSVTPNAAPIDPLSALKGSPATSLNPPRLNAAPLPWAAIGSSLGMTRQSAWERFSGEE
jgi:hypothetical protein